MEKRGNKYREHIRLDGKAVWVSGNTKKEVREKIEVLKADSTKKSQITLADAVQAYIDHKEAALQPSTVRNYRLNLEKNIRGRNIGALALSELNSRIMQVWVSNMASEGKSAKTIRNNLMLIRSTMTFYDYPANFKLSLPKSQKPKEESWTVELYQRYLNIAREKDRVLYVGALLCGICGLRRGEACALTAEDIGPGTITVNKDMTMNSKREWVIGPPKSETSNRVIEGIPDEVMKELPKEGKILPCHPDTLTRRNDDFRERYGFPAINFQGLRKFWSTSLFAIGISPVTVRDLGGWSNFATPNKHYLRMMRDEEAVKKMESFWSGVVSDRHKMNT